MDASKKNESRQFGRYNVTHETEVVFESKVITARITNESIGGVRIQLSVPPHFSVGSKVTIRQRDTETEGYVRNMGCLEDGCMFAGISWEKPEQWTETGQTSDFLNYGDLNVVCRQREDQGDGNSKIILWDGAEFVTATSSLVACSRDARAAYLTEMKTKLAILAKLYGIDTVRTRESIIERVLDFEFQPTTEPLTAQ